MRKRLQAEEIARIQQLRKVGYPLAAIGRLFGVDRSVIAYHTKNLPVIRLDSFLKAILPHVPIEGPPVPRGFSPSWEELRQTVKGGE